MPVFSYAKWVGHNKYSSCLIKLYEGLNILRYVELRIDVGKHPLSCHCILSHIFPLLVFKFWFLDFIFHTFCWIFTLAILFLISGSFFLLIYFCFSFYIASCSYFIIQCLHEVFGYIDGHLKDSLSPYIILVSSELLLFYFRCFPFIVGAFSEILGCQCTLKMRHWKAN
jgi:hypothetical protein